MPERTASPSHFRARGSCAVRLQLSGVCHSDLISDRRDYIAESSTGSDGGLIHLLQSPSASISAPCLELLRVHVSSVMIKNKTLTPLGTLVQCDPSIKAIIMKIDAERGNEFIVEDIDDETVLIKPRTEDRLKALLRDVSTHFRLSCEQAHG